jgi:hypothetical protein
VSGDARWPRILEMRTGGPSQKQPSKEVDPAKLMILIGKLCRALEVERREKPRMAVIQWERVSAFSAIR